MVERFRAEVEAVAGRVHDPRPLPEARALAREIVGGAAVARWADAPLDDVAEAEAPPAVAEVSLVLADAGIAESGAIGLVHGPGRPRAAGILPRRQVALLAERDLVATTSEALRRLVGGGRPPASIVLVGGPSRTSDIEQRSIRGVHAPAELDIVLFR